MTKKYFQALNYTLGNEDTRFEVELLKRVNKKHLLSIAGCGSRVLPLLATYPKTVTILDISEPQLLLTRLRLETIRQFEHEDFLCFWGFPPYAAYDFAEKRKKLFFEMDLDREIRDFFFQILSEVHWESLLYLGGWERTFVALSKVVQALLGSHGQKLFSFTQIHEQRQYVENHFPHHRWKAIIFGLGNRAVFNALLYKGDFIKKNVSESHFEYYFQGLERLMTTQLARESFFLSLCFFGKIIHPDGNTIEAEKENFNLCKEALLESPQISFLQHDLHSAINTLGDEQIDFASLSDVPSYFSGDEERNFLQHLRPKMMNDGIVVLRYYLREAIADESGFVDITPQFSDLIAQERVQMYRIKVLQKQN